jgi:hypothetical protein
MNNIKIKVKTSEAEDRVLNYLVGKCEGRKPSYYTGIVRATAHPDFPDSPPIFGPELNYSTDWALAGPIIEREGIALDCLRTCGAIDSWIAASEMVREGDEYSPVIEFTGSTPLIAAMRCYVASKLGDEVEVPEELKGVTA